MKKEKIQRQPWLPTEVRDNFRLMARYRGCDVTELFELAVSELMDDVEGGDRDIGEYIKDSSEGNVPVSMWLSSELLEKARALELNVSDAHMIYVAIMRFAERNNMLPTQTT